MLLQTKSYEFTPILGWSISRFELFNKCKRQYFYTYYSKHVPNVPQYKIKQLRDLTSVPLEVGNVTHDVVEAYLKRLQKSDSNIDETRFFTYAQDKTREYFSRKTFMEVYYKTAASVSLADATAKVEKCLTNFLRSPVCSWVFMKALTNKDNWLIEPGGYGETRLDGMKAYCKMDFLFPVEDTIHILDWKTGRKDPYKHRSQLLGYAVAASANFGIPWDRIFPKIVYLHPEFAEYEIRLCETDLTGFTDTVRAQTQQMHALCRDVEQNLPLPIESFPMTPSATICGQCQFRELCFPEGDTPSKESLIEG